MFRSKINPLSVSLNKYLDTLNIWFKSRNLHISATKSMATIFTTASNEVGRKLPISIDGDKVPNHKDSKVLGVILDPLLTFNQHAKSVKEKVNKRNNILKALASSAWGMEKEILLTTHHQQISLKLLRLNLDPNPQPNKLAQTPDSSELGSENSTRVCKNVQH